MLITKVYYCYTVWGFKYCYTVLGVRVLFNSIVLLQSIGWYRFITQYWGLLYWGLEYCYILVFNSIGGYCIVTEYWVVLFCYTVLGITVLLHM
jgi:hypothetical protein